MKKLCPGFPFSTRKYTMTLPHYQMAAGIYDIFNHICEQYFSGEDDNASDYISEGLMRSRSSTPAASPTRTRRTMKPAAIIMWAATWALNTLVAQWKVHRLDGAYAGAVGRRLHQRHPRHDPGCCFPAYTTGISCPIGLQKFKRFAVNVWEVEHLQARSDEQVANEGLDPPWKAWMQELGPGDEHFRAGRYRGYAGRPC